LGSFWTPFSFNIAFFCEKKGSKNRFKKRVSPNVKQLTMTIARGSLTAPPRVRGFLNKQQSEQETTTAAHF
jgi:hypothetical protein